MKVSITIPTLKDKDQVQKQIEEIRQSMTHDDYEIIASCIKQSASLNRNWCIDNSKGDIIIETDDDCTGYFKGWSDILVNALIEHPEYSIVSARPKKMDGSWCAILGDNSKNPDGNEFQKCIHTDRTGLNIVGSATICFRRDSGVRFDDNYVGACYEDSDFCMEMNKAHPDKQIVFANKCTIIHNEEKKGRGSSPGQRDYWLFNHNYFAKKWGIRI